MVSSNIQTFTVSETHGRVLRSQNHVSFQSQDVGWRSLYAAIFEEAHFQAIEPPISHPYLIYHLSRPTDVTRKIEGFPTERAVIGPRHICLAPGGSIVKTHHNGQPEILQVYVRQSIYETAVNEIYGCDASKAEILPRYAILDPLLEQLVLVIKAALQNGAAADRLYMDTVAQMIAVHLARRHSSRSRDVSSTTMKPFPGWRTQHLIEFIEEHIAGDLSLDAMAKEVKMCPLYLPRAFKAAVGKSPHQYVLDRRIERAKDLLRNTDAPIVEVALSAGFSSQSHLSNWFQRVVGISPGDYRRRGYHGSSN
jgi:AraC family transcriptional regulator